MSTNDPTGYWETLASSWKEVGGPAGPETPAVAAEIARRVRRESWRMAANVAAEAAVVVAALAVAAWLVGRPAAGAFEWITAGGIAGLLAATTAYGLTNRRGLWRAADRTTDAYLDLLRRRVAARLRALRFALWVLGVETVAFCAWIPFAVADDPSVRRMLGAYLFLAVWSGGALLVAVALRRRAFRDAEALRALGDEPE